MSSDGFAIRARNVSKHYLMFDRPEDRLKQMIVPRLQRLARRQPRRYYRDFVALDDVSFDVRRGETVGVVGRNGSGKSTLLQIICGTLQPTAGSIEINGRIAALLELGAGFNPAFTGRENVRLNASILGLRPDEIDARMDSILAFADIGRFVDQPVKTYSSGMYVRLAFATAINVDPDILVVDEALAVGDEAFQRKCFARIEQIKDRGGTILFVSHGVQTIVQLCTRALLIDRGELLLASKPKTVTSQYQRLISASGEAAQEIRTQILAMQAQPTEADFTSERAGAVSNNKIAEAIPAKRGRAPVSDLAVAVDTAATYTGLASKSTEQLARENRVRISADHADYFDPELKPKSTVSYEQRGACIRDVRVLTLAGEQVNVLQMGKRYALEYHTDFSVRSRHVGFGMSIRTVTGIPIGGVHTSQTPATRMAEIGSPSTIRSLFEFSCLLVPGTYFFSCGVKGDIGSGEVVLHRIVDASMVRVAPEADSIATALVDLDVVSKQTRV